VRGIGDSPPQFIHTLPLREFTAENQLHTHPEWRVGPSVIWISNRAGPHGATRKEILLSGTISNSSVPASACQIFGEEVENCVPCEVKPPKAGGKKKAGKRATAKKKK